jgi:transcriptional regulator with XRE-family HTH domain
MLYDRIAVMRTIGQRIHEARLALNITQTRLAELCGVTRAAVSQWEKDGTVPTGPNLVTLAQALRRPAAWLTGQSRDTTAPLVPRVAVVGYVGAGAQVFAIDDHARGAGFEEVDAPLGISGSVVAVRVRGNSMYPIEDGWLVFYGRDADGVDESCLNRLCVVKVTDGATLVKKLRKGTRKGHYTLESFNGPPVENVRLDWAARVMDIRPM